MITNFKRDWLKGVKIIDKEVTKLALEVASNVTEANRLKAKEPGKSDVYLCTLRAIPADKVDKLKALFGKSELYPEGRTEVPFKEMRDIFLTARIWVNNPANPPSLPIKGETVVVNVTNVPTKDDKSKLVLRVTNMVQSATKQAPEVNWDGFFDAIPMPTEETAEVAKTEVVGHGEMELTHS